MLCFLDNFLEFGRRCIIINKAAIQMLTTALEENDMKKVYKTICRLPKDEIFNELVYFQNGTKRSIFDYVPPKISTGIKKSILFKKSIFLNILLIIPEEQISTLVDSLLAQKLPTKLCIPKNTIDVETILINGLDIFSPHILYEDAVKVINNKDFRDLVLPKIRILTQDLIGRDANPNVQNSNFRSPLNYGLEFKDSALCKTFRSPLHYALEFKDYALCKTLLESGAQIPKQLPWTFFFVFSLNNPPTKNTEEIKAQNKKEIIIFWDLFQQYGASFNEPFDDTGTTLAMYIAKKYNVIPDETEWWFNFLFQNGYDWNIKNKVGKTALDYMQEKSSDATYQIFQNLVLVQSTPHRGGVGYYF